jgi:hypothetical protein
MAKKKRNYMNEDTAPEATPEPVVEVVESAPVEPEAAPLPEPAVETPAVIEEPAAQPLDKNAGKTVPTAF